MSNFSNKNFFFLWMFQTLALFGGELSRFTLPIWLFEQNHDLISFSIFVCFGLLPRLLSPLLGAIIDSLNKKKILLCSSLILIALSTMMSLVIAGFFSKSLWIICFLVFSMGIFSNLMHITSLSIIPQIASKDFLLQFNSFMCAAEYSVVLIAPLLAGGLVSLFGALSVILFDILLFSIAMFFLINVQFNDDFQRKSLAFNFTNLCKNITAGFSFIMRDVRLMSLIIILGFINFAFSFSFVAFTPMVLSFSQNDTWLLGKINAVGGGVQLITSLLIGYFCKPIFQLSLMLKAIIALGLFGPFIIGIVFSPLFWTIGYSVTLGCLSIINSSNNTFWQMHAPTNLQGTLFGIRRMISSAVAPIGTLLAGPLINWLLNIPQPTFIESGYQVVFLIAGLMILFIGIVGRSLNIFQISDVVKNG